MPATWVKNRHPLRNSYIPIRRSAPNAGRRSGARRNLARPAGNMRKALGRAGALAVVLLLFLGIGAGLMRLYHYCISSEFFEISQIEVQGLRQLNVHDILALGGLREGDNSLRIRIPDMEQKILQNPWIERIAIRRELPSRFIIYVTERIPCFWVLKDGALHYLDSSGRIIAPVEIGSFRSLPTLEIGSGGEEAIIHLAEFMETLRNADIPFDLSQISWLRISAGKGFELYWETKQLTMSVGIEDWRANLHRLGQVLHDIEKRSEVNVIQEILAADGQVWLQKI